MGKMTANCNMLLFGRVEFKKNARPSSRANPKPYNDDGLKSYALGVVFGVEFARFIAMMFGVKVVCVCNVGVMCGFLVVTIFMRCRSFAMMLCGVLVMFCGLVVML
jgi:hypothetical protein